MSDMQKMQNAEFKEAFDEFDKVRKGEKEINCNDT